MQNYSDSHNDISNPVFVFSHAHKTQENPNASYNNKKNSKHI